MYATTVPRGVEFVGVAYHGEQRTIPALAVDYPVGIEYFMPAVFGIGLGKHHELHVGEIALGTLDVFHQIIDFVRGQGQPEIAVGRCQGGLAAT